MKILNYWKIFKFTKQNRNDSYSAKLSHNENILEDFKVINNKLHGETYRLLRKFKSPQYNIIYSMRNKKGFNTFYFIQNYDVVITDKNGLVLDLFENLEPGYISNKYDEAYSIYFMTVGTIKYINVKQKDILKISRLSEWY